MLAFIGSAIFKLSVNMHCGLLSLFIILNGGRIMQFSFGLLVVMSGYSFAFNLPLQLLSKYFITVLERTNRPVCSSKQGGGGVFFNNGDSIFN